MPENTSLQPEKDPLVIQACYIELKNSKDNKKNPRTSKNEKIRK